MKKIILSKYLLVLMIIVMMATACSKKISMNSSETTSNVNLQRETSSQEINIDRSKEDSDQKSDDAHSKPFVKYIGEYKYVYIPTLKVQYDENTLLNNIIQSKWDKNSPNNILDKPDSYFNRYDIYFDKGISISHLEVLDKKEKISISGKISNIIFNKKYSKSIINGVTMSSSKSDVVNLLGKTHFEDTENKVFGYKTENFYIFFVGGENFHQVSIYRRNTDYNKETIEKILKECSNPKNETIPVCNAINTLDIQWPTYDYMYDIGYKYSIRRNSCGIGYLSQGVKIHENYCISKEESMPFMRIGGNYEGSLTSDISLPDKVEGLENFKSDIVNLELDKDYIFDSEIERLKHNKELKERIKKEGVLSPDETMIALRNDDNEIDPFLSGGYLIYLNNDKPNVEFKAVFFDPDHFTWLSNRYIAYDVFKKGLFIYDINKNESVCINGNHTAYLTSAKDGVLKFKHLNNYGEDAESTIKYSFDKEGNLKMKHYFE